MGLTQFTIKRLFAYSTISHVGFILLALSINSIESIRAFIFYLMQYICHIQQLGSLSISNLNAFIILISIGYSLYYYANKSKEYKQLLDKKKTLLFNYKGELFLALLCTKPTNSNQVNQTAWLGVRWSAG